MSAVLIAAVAFVAMEPITALTHRLVMHGPGLGLHRSHHRNAARSAAGETVGRFEANDAFPVMFAAVVMAAMGVGFNVTGFAALVPVGIGVTLYGAAYALVHDGYIHGRLGWVRRLPVPGAGRVLRRLEAAHLHHHEANTGPYGMLVPVMPRPASRPARRSTRH